MIMHTKSPVEIADRVSRKRAKGVALAAIAFVVIQAIIRPFLAADSGSTHQTTIDWWAVNAVVLLALLATGGGLLNTRNIRALVNDEVSHTHYRTAVVAGYWVAMTTAMGIYFVPRLEGVTARNAAYLIVTSSVVVALLVFSYLELRAHRDA
jgi:protein-S-isoprenylcysteine O-methyltransferase Ste14